MRHEASIWIPFPRKKEGREFEKEKYEIGESMNLKKVVLCVLLAQAPRQNAERVRAI